MTATMEDESAEAEAPERTALYRIRGVAGLLLYIGITNNVSIRWNGHQRVQPWWDELRTLTVEWYDSRPEAEAAEKAAIISERPKYNRTYLIPYKDRRRQFVTPPPSPPSDYAYVDSRADDDGLITLAAIAEFIGLPPHAAERLTERGRGPVSFYGTGEDRMYRAVDLKIWLAGNLRSSTKDPVSSNPVTGACMTARCLEHAVLALGYDKKEFDQETPEGRDEIWDAYLSCVRWLHQHPNEVAA